MTWDEWSEFYNEAARLEHAGDHEGASDAFQVVADAVEEVGGSHGGIDAAAWAREARRRAIQNHVLVWARRRWLGEPIYLHHVTFSQFPFGTFGRRRSRVDLSIRRVDHLNTWAQVTVGRRGDVRLEHDGSPASRARSRA